MRITRSHTMFVLMAVVLALVGALILVSTGCQSSVRIDPGAVKVSHKVTTITTDNKPDVPVSSRIVRVRIVYPGESHANPVPDRPVAPVSSTGPTADPK